MQSTTVLYMMLSGDIKPADHVIFADTGWEPTAVYEHLGRLEILMADAHIPFHRVSVGNIREDALDPSKKFASMPLYTMTSDGKKGMVRRQCTNEYKIQPLLREQRRLVGLKKGQKYKDHLATTVIGISYDESQRMRDPAFSWIKNDYPLVDLKMTRDDCIRWCTEHGYDRPPRSACIGCPFKTSRQWRQLRDEMPAEWEDAVDFDHNIRALMASNDRFYAVPYLHAQMKPLDLVDLRTSAEKGQGSLFDQECEGMCGV